MDLAYLQVRVINIALGHSSHFGLGLFMPEMESKPVGPGAIPKKSIDGPAHIDRENVP